MNKTNLVLTIIVGAIVGGVLNLATSKRRKEEQEQYDKIVNDTKKFAYECLEEHDRKKLMEAFGKHYKD